jgi:putative transposase
MRTHKYPSDITDSQWELIKDQIPVYPGGRPRTTDLRDVVDALFYLLRTGWQWRYLPKDFPPKSTVWRYFDEWRHNGTLAVIHDTLREQVRDQEKPTPRTTASIDSQSVDSSEGGEARGRDNHNKVDGRKRHIVVDSLGLILAVLVTAAHVDDASAAQELLPQLDDLELPELRTLFGDNKYHNYALYAWVEDPKNQATYRLEIISRPPGETGWVKLPIRWTVERTFAWLKPYRRLTVDREKSTTSAEAMIRLAMIQLMLNRLCPKPNQPEFHYRDAV